MSIAAASVDSARPNRGLHIALWVVQVLLALAFGMAGVMKATTPLEELGKAMPWVARSGAGLVRFIGISELLGALGLLLPALTRIRPILTPLAAVGLVVIMGLAAGVHTLNGEQGAVINAVLGGLAAFVAWGRWKAAPVAPRA